MRAKKEPKNDISEGLLEKAKEQRVGLLAEYHRTLQGLAVGLQKYYEKGWTWNADDMAPSDPCEWRRVGKLCYLMAQLEIIRHDLDYQASTRPHAPLWCVMCSGEFPGSPYLRVECPEHNNAPSLAASFTRLFGGN